MLFRDKYRMHVYRVLVQWVLKRVLEGFKPRAYARGCEGGFAEWGDAVGDRGLAAINAACNRCS